MQNKYDYVIVGSGVSGLYAALNLNSNKNILVISKSNLEDCDSHLAQGGICVLPEESDYDNFFNDTLKAGHYENDKDAVKEMILNSQDVISDLVKFNVDFTKNENGFVYTREGAHSRPRILYHKDITGKEITRKLLAEVKTRKNITLSENTILLDIIENNGECSGVLVSKDGKDYAINAKAVLLASGGVGGLYENSTNFKELTGDALTICYKHHIELKDVNYVQIHPTTLYSKKKGRRFLISESVRGEGALLYNSEGKRFADERLPRDILTNKILAEMKREGSNHVYLDMRVLGEDEVLNHFPNIYQACLEEGYDPLKDLVPVVPAQHYYMGGVKVNLNSKTSMNRLYCLGEAACNGVHGKNRLASNSLLESLVFAKKAALDLNNSNLDDIDLGEINYSREEFEKFQNEIVAFVKGEKEYEFN